MLSRFSFHCGRQYSLGTTMDWTGAAPTRSFGCALLGILVMVAIYGDWPRGARILEITQQPFSVNSWIRMEDNVVHSRVVLSP